MSITTDEYKNRVFFKGKTKRDYVNTKVRESIDSLVDDSQYGFVIKVNGVPHEVAILSTRSTQDYERANVIAHNDAGLDRGSLFEWNNDRWIVLQKMFRPEQPGFNGYAYKCTGELKWIDEEGNLQIRPGYINSGRTTNSLTYTPDVNYKFDNILLHDTDWSMIAAVQQDLSLHAEMRFIIKGKAYRVTNIDNVSIENVSILSMVDDKLKDDDDLINEIASMPDYTITPDVELPVKLFGGDIKDLPVTIMKKGVIQTKEDYYLESLNPEIVEVQGKKIIGRGEGVVDVICHLTKNPLVQSTITVQIVGSHEEAVDTPVYYIVGPDFIEWNTSSTYTIPGDKKWSMGVEYFSRIKHEPELFNPEKNEVTIAIKDKYAGSIIITGENGEDKISKEILIKTL